MSKSPPLPPCPEWILESPSILLFVRSVFNIYFHLPLKTFQCILCYHIFKVLVKQYTNIFSMFVSKCWSDGAVLIYSLLKYKVCWNNTVLLVLSMESLSRVRPWNANLEIVLKTVFENFEWFHSFNTGSLTPPIQLFHIILLSVYFL